MKYSLLALVVFLAVGAAVLHRTVLGGEVLSSAVVLAQHGPFAPDDTELEWNTTGIGDQFRTFEPWLRYSADALAEDGRLPFWKDTTFCGAPLLGNGQSALFYPPNLLAILLGGPKPSQAFLALFKLVVGALSAFLLARHLRMSPLASVAVGLSFSFFGFQVSYLTFPLTNVSCLLPLVVLAADRVAQRPSGGRMLVLAAACALQHLGGHPETAMHSQIFAFLFAAVRSAAAWRNNGAKTALVQIAAVTGGFVLGAMLGAIQILPVAEYVLNSEGLDSRNNKGGGLAQGPALLNVGFLVCSLVAAVAAIRLGCARRRLGLWGALLFAAIVGGVLLGLESTLSSHFLSALSPDWQGEPLRNRARTSYIVAAVTYTGPAIVLALLAVLYGTPRRLALALGATAVLCVLVSLRAPVFADLVDHLPILSVMANERLALIANLCVSLLAGLGLDALRSGMTDALARRRFAWLVFAPVLALVCAMVSAYFIGSLTKDKLPTRPKGANLIEAQLDPYGPPSEGLREFSGWLAPPVPLRSAKLVIFGIPPRPVTLTRVKRSSLRPENAHYTFRALIRDSFFGTPRVPLYIEATAENGKRFRTRLLRAPADPRQALLTFPLMPSDGRAPYQMLGLLACALLALYAVRKPGSFWFAGPLLVITLGAGIAAFAYGVNPALPAKYHFPPSPTFDFLRSAAPDGRVLICDKPWMHETLGYYGVPQVLGYDGIGPRRVAKLLRLALDRPDGKVDLASLPAREVLGWNLLGNMSVRYALGPQSDPLLTDVDYPGAESVRKVQVQENATFMPRARLVPSARVVADEQALAELGSPGFRGDLTVLLAAGEAIGNPDPDAGSARIEVARPDRVLVAVEPQAECMLLLCDTYYPGWTARVDGELREIQRANVAFRAVRVGPGDEQVEFRYEPLSFRLGVWLGIAGLLVAAFLTVRFRGGPRGT